MPTFERRGSREEVAVARAYRIIPALVSAGSIAIFVTSAILASDFDLVVSAAMGCNFLIMGMALNRLLKKGFPLAPASIFLFMSIATYSFGNIGLMMPSDYPPVIMNTDYYRRVGVLTVIGLMIYVQVLFWMSETSWSGHEPIRAPRGMLKQIQEHVSVASIVFTTAISLGVIAYLSSRYEFVGGYFRDMQTQSDKFLASALYYFIFLSAAICVCGAENQREKIVRVSGLTGWLILLVLVMSMRSRLAMLMFIGFSGVLWLTLRPLEFKRMAVAVSIIAAVAFSLGTVVKIATTGETATTSITDNLVIMGKASIGSATRDLSTFAEKEAGQRAAGFEFPAALLMAQDNGAEFMYGEGLLNAAIGLLPSIMRPEGNFSERFAIWENARNYGMPFGDVAGVTLSTGLAELGILGVVPVYALLAVWHLIMWRVARHSPLLFLSYLAHVPALINQDLLWDSIAESIRLWLFMFCTLLVVRPVVLPGLKHWK